MNLTEGRIGSTLLRFAIPFMLASLLQALYGATGIFVVGQFTDSVSVSAVSIGSQLMQTITSVILGISMGGTVLIGKCIGEKDTEAAAKAIGNIALVFIVIAIVLTPLVFFETDTLVQLMKTPAEAVSDTRCYILLCAAGIPFIIGYNVISGIFRGLGDSRTPLYFVAAACVLNIILDFALVAWTHMGAAGAAIAMTAAQAISFLLSLLFVRCRGFTFVVPRSSFRLDRESTAYILKVGIPLALQDGFINVSFLIITAIINSMGLVASASVGVVEKIIVFAMLPPSAFASAVATMTAQNVGAGKPERAKKSLYLGIGFSLIIGVSVCVYSQIRPDILIGVFTRDLAVIEMASGYLRSYSIDCILICFVFCYNSYFSGKGKSMVALFHSILATFAVRIPMSYCISKMAGATLFEMGFASDAASALSMVICIAYYVWFEKKGHSHVLRIGS